MKKIILISIILFIILLIIFPSVCFAGLNLDEKPLERPIKFNTYGMVFVYNDNAPLFYYFITHIKVDNNHFLEFLVKSVGLVNKGEIVGIYIRAPVSSYVKVYYKKHMYWFRLEPYAVNDNYILFIFQGNM